MPRKLKFDIRLWVLITLILLVTSSIILHYFYHQNNLAQIKKNYIYELNNEYLITTSVYSDMADLVYNLIINTPEVLTIFSRGINSDSTAEKNMYRKLLLQELSGLYSKLIQYNFRQLQFIETNNKSFLRYHRPEKYGDDLTGIRYSVEYANRTKQKISGFEEGRIFNGYRFVYPLFFKNNHIGAIEISVSLKAVIKQISQKFDKNAQFIILKQHVNKKVFESEQINYIPWFVDDSYVLDKEISQNCILKSKINPDAIYKIQKALTENLEKATPFCIEVDIDENPEVLTFIPIDNFQEENIAYIFGRSDAGKLHEQSKNFYIVFITLILLLIMLIVFTIYYKISQKKIEIMATHDSLTKVCTRGFFLNNLKLEFIRYNRYKKPFCLLMIDVDHFKSINDKHGHAAGDIVLSGIAEIIKNNIRKSDFIGRYGGEEFIVLLPETTYKEAIIVAESLRKAISNHQFHILGTVTISCGISQIHDGTISIEEFINDADKKMYKAKESGRNRVVYD